MNGGVIIQYCDRKCFCAKLCVSWNIVILILKFSLNLGFDFYTLCLFRNIFVVISENFWNQLVSIIVMSGGTGSQYYSLRWNNHPINLVTVFTNLYQVTKLYTEHFMLSSYFRPRLWWTWLWPLEDVTCRLTKLFSQLVPSISSQYSHPILVR